LTDDLVNLLYRTGLPPAGLLGGGARVDGTGAGSSWRMGAAVRGMLPPVIDGIFGPDQFVERVQ